MLMEVSGVNLGVPIPDSVGVDKSESQFLYGKATINFKKK